jgi:type II secretory pathway component PulF
MAIDLAELGSHQPERGADLKVVRGGSSRPGRRQFDFRRNASLDDLVIFTRQLAMLVHSGNGLVPSIDALAQQVESDAFRNILVDVHKRLQDGLPLSDALDHHPDSFDHLFVSLIRAGELSGQLQESLRRLSSVLEGRRTLRSRVKEALTYPAILLSITGGVMILLFTFILPKFDDLFSGLGAELPFFTRLLLGISDLISSRWYIALPILLVTAAVSHRAWGMSAVVRFRDELKLRLPIARQLYEEMYLFQLFLSLGLLIKSRVPLLDAIEITRGTVNHYRYQEFFSRLAEQVANGQGLSRAFNEASLFPETVKLMVSTGESSGSLEEVMLHLGDRYREDLEVRIRRLSSAIEPVMLVFMGVVVGIVAMALILPLFKLSSALR